MLQTSRRRVAGTRCVLANVLALFVAVPRFALAQSTSPADSITNEYRVTLVATKPAADREKVNNIWRLNIKQSLPRRGQRLSLLPDFDE